jgi:hypothetical protein
LQDVEKKQTCHFSAIQLGLDEAERKGSLIERDFIAG